jgi:phosphonate transport system ATP-binding protein
VDLALKYATRVIGIRAGEVVYDGPVKSVTKEVLDQVYNGNEIPQMGKEEHQHGKH